MITLRLKARADQHGVLHLETPVGIPGAEVEIVISYDSVDEPLDAMGYPLGYFEETYGSMADDPLEIGDDLPLEIRDEIE